MHRKDIIRNMNTTGKIKQRDSEDYSNIENNAYETLDETIPVKNTVVHKQKKEKESTEKGGHVRRTKILFSLIGVLIGAVIAGVAVYFISIGNKTLDWSSWSSCSVTCGHGKQYRFKVYGGDHFESKTCFHKPCQDDDVLLEVEFKRSSLPSSLFISDNNKTLSNHYTKETPNHGNDDQQFQNYSGVVGDHCVQDNTIMYYTVGYQYKIISTHNSNWLVLELGLAEWDKIDGHYAVGETGTSGLSFRLKNCIQYDRICLSTKPNSLSTFSHNTVGSRINGKFDIMIDRVKNTFAIIENHKVRYRFSNVKSNVNLCPVFGVYNPDRVEVKMWLGNFYNMTKLQPFLA